MRVRIHSWLRKRLCELSPPQESVSCPISTTNDPVRLYLREMAVVPLLTRDGEVSIARRMERGRLRVLKAISRSPICIEEMIQIGERLRRGELHIREIVTFNEQEPITEERIE